PDDLNNKHKLNYAIPTNLSELFLQKWIKHDNNPLVVDGELIINKTKFCDPKLARIEEFCGKGQGIRWCSSGRNQQRMV
ncbi:hypothetical protein H5410_062407, partial [Solanum commersonii]